MLAEELNQPGELVGTCVRQVAGVLLGDELDALLQHSFERRRVVERTPIHVLEAAATLIREFIAQFIHDARRQHGLADAPLTQYRHHAAGMFPYPVGQLTHFRLTPAKPWRVGHLAIFSPRKLGAGWVGSSALPA